MSIEFLNMPISAVKPYTSKLRVHSKRQKELLEKSIVKTGFAVPILVDADTNVIIDGHLRYELAVARGDKTIGCVCVSGLKPHAIRNLRTAIPQIASLSGWDREKLLKELTEIVEIADDDFEITDTGFEVAEFDQLMIDLDDSPEPSDTIDRRWLDRPVITKSGELWILGSHRLLCSDSKCAAALNRLMDGNAASCLVADAPYNLLAKVIGSRGARKHHDFIEAAGEMSSAEFEDFLRITLANAARVSRPGSLHYIFMDWRHLEELLAAGKSVYGGNLRNIICWVKTNAGMGSFYRSQHEMVGVFQAGTGKPINNVQLGKFGRNRSNVWTYPGANAFGSSRLDDLSVHPTVKPVRMISDILLDCTKRGDICLDLFAGSGTIFLAAEKIGRRAFGMEIDPIYVDICIRRWQKLTNKDAVLDGTGQTFTDIERERSAQHKGAV